MIGKSVSNELNIGRSVLTSPMLYGFDNAAIGEDLKRYKSALESRIADNLKLVDELPPLKYLSKAKIRKYLRKKIKDDLQKDKLFEKSVEIDKYAGNIAQHLQAYYREIFDYHLGVKERLDSGILDACRMYFNSDLPLRFLKALENSILIEKDFVDIYDKRLRREKLRLISYRANRKKFERLCSLHNMWIEPFEKLLKESTSTRRKLFWYVDFSNSKTLKDIFRVKKIEVASTDIKIIEGYVECLENLTQDMGLLVEKNIEFQPIEKYDTEDGSRTIREVMDLLNATEV